MVNLYVFLLHIYSYCICHILSYTFGLLIICIVNIYPHEIHAQTNKVLSNDVPQVQPKNIDKARTSKRLNKIKISHQKDIKKQNLIYTANYYKRSCIWSYSIEHHAKLATMLLCEENKDYQAIDLSPSGQYLLVKIQSNQENIIKIYDLYTKTFIPDISFDHSVMQALFLEDKILILAKDIVSTKTNINTKTKILHYAWHNKEQKLLYHSSRPIKSNIPMTLSPDRKWLSFGIKDQKARIILLAWENAKIEQLDKGYISLVWSTKEHAWNAFNYRENYLLKSDQKSHQKSHQKTTRKTIRHRRPRIEHLMYVPELNNMVQLQIKHIQNTNFSVQLHLNSTVNKGLILSNRIYLNFKIPLTQQILYQSSTKKILWVETNRDTIELKSVDLDLSYSQIGLGVVKTVIKLKSSQFKGMFLQTVVK
jgi:hypothetical protein